MHLDGLRFPLRRVARRVEAYDARVNYALPRNLEDAEIELRLRGTRMRKCISERTSRSEGKNTRRGMRRSKSTVKPFAEISSTRRFSSACEMHVGLEVRAAVWTELTAGASSTHSEPCL